MLREVRRVSRAYYSKQEIAIPGDEEDDPFFDDEGVLKLSEKDIFNSRISKSKLIKAYHSLKLKYEVLKVRLEMTLDHRTSQIVKELNDEILRLNQELNKQIATNKEQDKLISNAVEFALTQSLSEPEATLLVPVQVKSARYSNILRKKELKKLYKQVADLKIALDREIAKNLASQPPDKG